LDFKNSEVVEFNKIAATTVQRFEETWQKHRHKSCKKIDCSEKCELIIISEK
jgi:hypothetical protein